MKKFAAGLIAVAMSVTMLAGCGVPANTVHSVDDLEGKTIGVQLGTTGDIYAEDVKDAKVEKYNKGADMMQAVCDKLGYELKIDDMAFDSIISAVQSGKADVGVAGMTVTPDREKNVLFSDTYTSSSQVIIVRKK